MQMAGALETARYVDFWALAANARDLLALGESTAMPALVGAAHHSAAPACAAAAAGWRAGGSRWCREGQRSRARRAAGSASAACWRALMPLQGPAMPCLHGMRLCAWSLAADRPPNPRAMPACCLHPSTPITPCLHACVRPCACAVPGFYEAVRAYICQTLSLSFSRITRATLASCLQLQGDTLAAFVSACAGGSWRPALRAPPCASRAPCAGHRTAGMGGVGVLLVARDLLAAPSPPAAPPMA